jgi:hypothetical protein
MQQNCICYYRNGDYLNYPADPQQIKIMASILTSGINKLQLYSGQKKYLCVLAPFLSSR